MSGTGLYDTSANGRERNEDSELSTDEGDEPKFCTVNTLEKQLDQTAPILQARVKDSSPMYN